MASVLGSGAAHRCSQCLRRAIRGGPKEEFWRSSQQQIRGKRKMPNNSETVTVRLLKDLAGFGPKGSIVPAPGGWMRNRFFPKRIAEYVMAPELRNLKRQNIPIERDFTFSIVKQRAPEHELKPTESPNSKPKPVAELLSPQRSAELLSILLPRRLDFYRMPIAAQGMTTLDSDTAPGNVPQHEHAAIHGSVSFADVVSAIREILQENDEASRVVLSTSDLEFVAGDLEADNTRLKHLGEYEVGIRLAGVPEMIKRKVRVLDPRPNSPQTTQAGGPLNAGGPQTGENAVL